MQSQGERVPEHVLEKFRIMSTCWKRVGNAFRSSEHVMPRGQHVPSTRIGLSIDHCPLHLPLSITLSWQGLLLLLAKPLAARPLVKRGLNLYLLLLDLLLSQLRLGGVGHCYAWHV